MKNRVLVVDDNPKNLQIIAALLSENNYLVEVALNGASAIKWLNQSKFDAILLDVMMPEMNGFEACEIIKKNPANSNIPIIFLTALHDIDSITEGFEKGGVDYVTKPFNHSELLIRLNTHVELKKSREKLIDLNGWLTVEVDKKTVELKDANDDLLKLNDELMQFDVAKNDFLNSISHELRTPLNGIVGSINLLNTFEHDEYIQEILSLLDSSVNKLEKYSYAALQISNLQLKGESQLNLGKVEFVSLVRSMMPAFTNMVNVKGLELQLSSQCDEIFVDIDMEYIQNALRSILDCSLIFSTKGKICFNISSTTSQQVQLEIKDSGSLYQGNELKHFFKSVNNQNYQFERNNAMELYLAKMIVLLHNGEIEFINNEDKSGTRTLIKLPISRDSIIS